MHAQRNDVPKARAWMLNWWKWLLRCLLLWLMGGVLLSLFAPHWTSLFVHELLGLVAGLVVLVHLVLNRWFWTQFLVKPQQWLMSKTLSNVTFHLKRGKTADKARQLESWGLLQVIGQGLNGLLPRIVGLGLVISLLATIISGLHSSQYLCAAVDWGQLWALVGIDISSMDWRQMHTMSANYMLIFCGWHLGLHAHTLWSFLPPGWVRWVQLMSLLVALHGIEVWISGDYWANLTGQLSFSFWDFEASVVWFFTDKLAVLALLAWIAHALQLLSWYISAR